MSSLRVQKVDRTVKPPYGTPPNFARLPGLRFLAPFWEREGAAIYDPVAELDGAASNLTRGEGESGITGVFNGTSTSIDYSTDPAYGISAGGIFMFLALQLPAALSTTQYIFSRRSSAGGDAFNYGLGVTGTNKIEFIYNNISYHIWNSTDTISTLGIDDGATHTISVSHQYGDGARIVVMVDGRLIAGSWVSNGGGETPTNDSGAHLLLGAGFYNAPLSHWTGSTELAALANEWVDEGLAREIHLNPFILFEPEVRYLGLTSPQSYMLQAEAGSFALSGQAATLRLGYGLTAGAGSFALSGQAAGLALTRRLTAGAGSFALSGQDAALNSPNPRMMAAAGSFVLTGQAATLSSDQIPFVPVTPIGRDIRTLRPLVR